MVGAENASPQPEEFVVVVGSPHLKRPNTLADNGSPVEREAWSEREAGVSEGLRRVH